MFGIKRKKKSDKDKKKKKEKEITELKEIKPDNYAESLVRKRAENAAIGSVYAVYDIYKKAHGMASTREPV